MRIQAIIGVKPMEIMSDLKKVTPNNLREAIENYAEFEKRIKTLTDRCKAFDGRVLFEGMLDE